MVKLMSTALIALNLLVSSQSFASGKPPSDRGHGQSIYTSGEGRNGGGPPIGGFPGIGGSGYGVWNYPAGSIPGYNDPSPRPQPQPP